MVKHSLPGPDNITRVELDNGIVVLTRENFYSQSVALQGYVRSGSLYDAADKLGTSEFTAALMMRGTQSRGFDEIFEAQESVGARLAISSGTHLSAVNGYCLAEDLPDQLCLLSELLREPLFDPTEMEKLRNQFLAGLALRAQSTSAISDLNFDSMLYRDHLYARPDDGYPETVAAITREDLVRHHAQTYGPKGMVICLVGAIKPQQAVEWANKAFGAWQNPDQLDPIVLSDVDDLPGPATKHAALPGKTQTDLLMGVIAMTRKHPDFYPGLLANSILGQFGMMGRLGEQIRERHGLAYSISSGLGASSTVRGTWDISAGVNPKNLTKTIDLIHVVIKELLAEGINEEEMRDNQDAFVGRLPLSLESNRGVAKAILDLERKKLSYDHYYNFEGIIRAITREQVNHVARKYLGTENYVVSTCGPKLTKKGS